MSDIKFVKDKFDIHIEELEHHKSNGLDSGWVKLQLSGNDLNVKICNALRRVVRTNIPTYAFPVGLIKIDHNTSVAFNNDYMRGRISQLPISGIKSELFSLHEKYWKNVNYADPNRLKHDDELHIEANLKVHNNTNEIMDVTTNDLRVFVDAKKVQMYNTKYPILIIQLKPDESISFSARGALGVGENNTIWDGARNSYYYYEDVDSDGNIRDTHEREEIFDSDGKILDVKTEIVYKSTIIKREIATPDILGTHSRHFEILYHMEKKETIDLETGERTSETNVIESSKQFSGKNLEKKLEDSNWKCKYVWTVKNCQFDEYETIMKGCKYLAKRLTDILKDLEELDETYRERKITLNLVGESHTIGGMLGYEFQSHPDIQFACAYKPDYLISSIVIKVKSYENSPTKPMIECVNILIRKILHIGSLITSLSK